MHFHRLFAFAVVLCTLLNCDCKSDRNSSSNEDSTTEDNLIRNGGFETFKEGDQWPKGWYSWHIGVKGDSVAYPCDDKIFHSGERSAGIFIDKNHPVDHDKEYKWTQKLIGWEAGARYEFTGWIKTTDLTGAAWIGALYADSSRTNLVEGKTSEIDYPITGTTDWTHVRAVFTVPPGTGEVLVRAVSAAPANGSGSVWFDDMQVKLLK